MHIVAKLFSLASGLIFPQVVPGLTAGEASVRWQGWLLSNALTKILTRMDCAVMASIPYRIPVVEISNICYSGRINLAEEEVPN